MGTRRWTRVFGTSPVREAPTLSNSNTSINRRSLSTAWANLISRESAKVRHSKIFRVYKEDRSLNHSTGFKSVSRAPRENFPTGSKYDGEWDDLGMCGNGTYCMPHNVQYEGGIQDGMFHGYGILKYPMGQTIEGEWYKGNMLSCTMHFKDGLDYEYVWDYCKMPDRRFYKSIKEGMRPAGRSLLTNSEQARPIPEGCYDTGDGFYNPKIKCVISAVDTNKILRVPTQLEEQWISSNCRKAWDEPTGYRPDLFEHWVGVQSNHLKLSSDDSIPPPPPTSETSISIVIEVIDESKN